MSEVGSHDFQKGKTQDAVSILTGASSSVDLITTGYERLDLLARMGATAAGDLVVAVFAYEDDGTTLFAQALPTDQAVAAVLTSSVSRLQATYKLGGIDKVSVKVTNGNASTQIATVTYYLAD
jgi:hypothetical protein